MINDYSHWFLALVVVSLGLCGYPGEATADPVEPAAVVKSFFGKGYKGFSLDKLKGHEQPIGLSDLRDAKSYGANLIRVMVTTTRCSGCDRYHVSRRELAYVEDVLRLASELEMSVVVSLETWPNAKNAEYWDNSVLQDSLKGVWGGLISKLRDYPSLVGYELINEPDISLTKKNLALWKALADGLIAEVYASDPSRVIIIQQPIRGGPKSFVDAETFNNPNVVYSLHFYEPGSFTHQGILGIERGADYPGRSEWGGQWDVKFLSDRLEPVRKFVRANNLPGVYVGEFGCIRWAPRGACERWVQDLVPLFEGEGWPWTFHAFRQWEGWDPEIENLEGNGRLVRSKTSPMINQLRSFMIPSKQ